MYIYYNRSTVTGTKRDERGDIRYSVTDDFIHRMEQDPILMAIRRDNRMAGADRFSVETVKCFRRWLDVGETRRKRDIPHSLVPEYEF